MRVNGRGLWTMAMLAMAMLAMPAAAQFSDGYKFLKAVRDKDGGIVTEMIDQPGSTIINTRDYGTGDGALHIVVKRRDAQWLAFLLSKGARRDIRDAEGNTPLITAALLGFQEGIQLLAQGPVVNIGNNRGETALIVAVQKRDVATVRLLLAAGANPRQNDRIAGMSARDYAAQDRRSGAILKMLDEAKAAKPVGPVAGPKL